MTGVAVTIYNDDHHARDIQVVQLSTVAGRDIKRYEVQKAKDPDDAEAKGYELLPGDILIITATGT